MVHGRIATAATARLKSISARDVTPAPTMPLSHHSVLVVPQRDMAATRRLPAATARDQQATHQAVGGFQSDAAQMHAPENILKTP